MSQVAGPLGDLLTRLAADLHLNPLYALPVTAVLALCLLVYAFGFRSSCPVPPSLHSLPAAKPDASSGSRKKRSRSNDNSHKHAANRASAASSAAAAAKTKPKAVVHPLRQ